MLPHVIIVLYSCVTHVTSQFQCQGTCYSGSFPKNKNVTKGKHLVGYSYKNITTRVPQTCFSSCINDCRCKAFQMKDVRCELMDEDKTSKAAEFVSKTGYVYYDLHQTFYKGSSHMVQPAGVCYNGCCRTQSCMNGGTCVEHCNHPKEKFTCKCTAKYYGKMCEIERDKNSCIDVLKTSVPGTIPANGTYIITRSDTKTAVPVYCAFDSPNQAWTLIESFSLEKNTFKYTPFSANFPQNESTPPNWEEYRLSLSNMQYIRSKATMFRATCDYEKRSSLIPDFLLGLLTKLDIMSSNTFSGYCKTFLRINIVGKECFDCTVRSFKMGGAHFHIDPSNVCDFQHRTAMISADSFGFYDTPDPTSTCTATQQSTTQWWLGEQQ